MKVDNNNINVFVRMKPFTTDPIEFDSETNHLIFGSVYATLITDYNKNGIQGYLANSWVSKDENKKWIFFLREDLYFSDGSLITPEIILKSFKRTMLALKVKDSDESFLDLLVGYSDLKSVNDDIQGLKLNGNKLTFHFKKSMPKLLTFLGFGMYAIVHPDDYNDDGSWKSRKQLNASGSYYIEVWDENKVRISLNKNFPKDLGHQEKFESVTFLFERDNVFSGIDLYSGKSVNNKPEASFTYKGGVANGIGFVRLNTWKKLDSPLRSLDFRIKLRNCFYEGLKERNFKPTISFFPLGINGIEEMNLREGCKRKTAMQENFKQRVRELKYRPFSSQDLVFSKAIQGTYKSLSIQKVDNIPLEVVSKQKYPDLENHVYDMGFFTSAIDVYEPSADIKFMFESKSGIMLPDETGAILKELSSRDFSYQKINKLLIEQGIVWPITHFSYGFYHKDFIDFDSYNIINPALNFLWIGQK